MAKRVMKVDSDASARYNMGILFVRLVMKMFGSDFDYVNPVFPQGNVDSVEKHAKMADFSVLILWISGNEMT